MKYLVVMYQTIAGVHQVCSPCHVIHVLLVTRPRRPISESNEVKVPINR